MGKEQIIDLVLLHDEELAKLKKALPAIRAEMEAQLGERVAELTAKHIEGTRAELAVKQTLLSKEAQGIAQLELLAQAGAIKKELAEFAERALAALLVKHEGKVAEITPLIIKLAEAAAAHVTKEYAAKQPDLPALIRKEFAGTGGAITVNAFKGPWQDGVNYQKGDIVYFRGSSFLVLQTTKRGEFPNIQNQNRPNATYLIIAGAGAPGPKGQDAAVSGAITVSSITVSNLTSGRVTFATTAGLLTDNSALTFNSGTGALSATNFVGTFNGNTWTAGTGVLTIAAAKTLTVSNTLTLAGTDSSTLNIGAGGTLGTGAFQPQTVLTGTAGQVTVSNAGVGATTLSLPTALTGINSITSVAASTLILATGTFGTAVTFASATGAPTFAANVTGSAGFLATGLDGSGIAFFANISGTSRLRMRNSATGATGQLSIESAASDEFDVTASAVLRLIAGTGAGIFFQINSSTVAGSFSSAGVFNVATTTEASAGAGAITTAGGISTTKALYVGSATASTTTGTGSGIFGGGIGVAGAGWFGGLINTASTITTLGGTFFHITSSALTDGAAASLGTLTNAPSAGNPTKWIQINDNGTTRKIPTWT